MIFAFALSGCASAGNIDPSGGPKSVKITSSGAEFFADTHPFSWADSLNDGLGNGTGDTYMNLVIPGMQAGDDGNWSEDIADQTEALQQDPKMDSAHLVRASAYEEINEPEKAIADATAVIQTDPAPHAPGMLETAYLFRSQAYLKKHMYGEALADANEVVSLDSKSAEAWNSRCWTKAIMGNLSGALSDCDQSLLLAPNESNTRDSRGFVYLKMKNYDAAIADYNAALSHGRKTASSLYGLGLAKQAKGDPGAQAEFTAAEKRDPHIASNFGT